MDVSEIVFPSFIPGGLNSSFRGRSVSLGFRWLRALEISPNFLMLRGAGEKIGCWEN